MKQRRAELCDQMQPRDLVERVRVFVLPEPYGPFDLAEIEARESGWTMDVYRAAERSAFGLGETLASDAAALSVLLPDLMRSASRRVRSLGQGLALGSDDPVAVWRKLIATLIEVAPEDRRSSLPAGFLAGLHEREPNLVDEILDNAAVDANLALHFAQFQATVPIDKAGVRRLRTALDKGLAPIASFEPLAFGRAPDVIDADDLASLIDAIALKPDGYFIALHILSMRFFSDLRQAQTPPDERLVTCGRGLLLALPLDLHDARLRELELVAEVSLKGEGAAAPARALCRRLLDTNGETIRNWHDYERLVLAIFASQPRVALDEFTDPRLLEDDARLWLGLESVVEQAIDEVPATDLLEWLCIDPRRRALRLAPLVALLRPSKTDDMAGLSHAAAVLIRHAPDRAAVLEILDVLPSSYGYSGSAATFFEQCRVLLRELEDPKDTALMAWLRRADQVLAREVEHWRTRVRETEQRFED